MSQVHDTSPGVISPHSPREAQLLQVEWSLMSDGHSNSKLPQRKTGICEVF